MKKTAISSGANASGAKPAPKDRQSIAGRKDQKRRSVNTKDIRLSLSEDIAHIRDKEDLIHIMRYKLKEVLNFNDITIGVFNKDKTMFRVMVAEVDEGRSVHPDFQQIAFSEYDIKDGIHDVLIRTNTACRFYIDDLLKKNPDKHPGVQFIADTGIKEIAGTKLVYKNEEIGFITLLSEEANTFTPAHLKLLYAISDLLSVAVANIIANELITQQLAEINRYKEILEEQKSYLQDEVSGNFNHSEIIGEGPEMQKVFSLLAQVSASQSSVLILGETGTGKELVARAIHNASPRKNKIMVKVNCATLPANLIESELFGHEKGSFTGAIDRRIGKFELADQGTLFLDEIGEMPLELQVKLLRAIQEKEIERVGGNSVIKTDVRIIAATNRNLNKEVSEGRFRSDLYYRLNVFPITLPPLRERKEDIPVLAGYFKERFARSTGRKNIRIAAKAIAEMMSYHWPGNIRELEHLMERSILLAEGNVVKSIHLPILRNADAGKESEKKFSKTLQEMERDYILSVLKQCNGKIFGIGGAAEILGLHVSTLNSKMKKLGILKEQSFVVKKT